MTRSVAAVILSARPEASVELVEGVARVRHLADIAASGGAAPVVVVSADPDGSIATALGGSTATLVPPAPIDRGPVGQIVHGIEAARAAAKETSAALVWPARIQWVDRQTITALIEAHAGDPTSLLRPVFEGQPGWPILVPLGHVDALRAVASNLMPDEVVAAIVEGGVPERRIDVGDPGVTHDSSVPRADLPAAGG